MSWILATAFALIGFAGLCQSIRKHQRTVFDGMIVADQDARRYRLIGWLFIIASATVCLVYFGVGIGLIAFSGVATLASVTIIVMLTFWPAWVAKLCPFPRWLRASGDRTNR